MTVSSWYCAYSVSCSVTLFIKPAFMHYVVYVRAHTHFLSDPFWLLLIPSKGSSSFLLFLLNTSEWLFNISSFGKHLISICYMHKRTYNRLHTYNICYMYVIASVSFKLCAYYRWISSGFSVWRKLCEMHHLDV